MARSFAIRNLYTMNFKPLSSCITMSLVTQITLAILCFSIPLQDKLGTFISIQLPVIYVNYVIIGIPLFNAIWGEENNEITSVIIMSNDLIIVPIYQILSSIWKIRKNNQIRRENNEPEEKFSYKIILRSFFAIFKSPIIQGIIVGIAWSLTKIKLPIYLDKLMLVPAQTISACALFCVGGFLAQHSLIACKWYEFIIAISWRFIIMPFFGLLFGWLMHLSNSQIRQCCTMASVTSAVASYPMSNETGVGQGIASTMIFWTTILCVPFIIAWLYVLDSLKLFIEN
ncbi:Auxin Efflux Carrier family protein [Trichomonas vaginalis G3]|uniref:Auxin Efflux Carrier family protein n=1 Tax=Trichomonas vaginalis (strain ATCC PRA-98 / G3) TaxID=412133 RepID=A2FPY2_TRIV3|nr:intracellular auxin transport [Trichomonas vaginalis G3]EAX93041.1 Auxin Efflux Carrier family protein [Trichomonas vaginalis G3]KAI5543787.1 intracellular auxin transport [Trichomonas vaginalis G3]|eukprot:XP_001305971.1 Auxin Efflux Carrier family protein [Trichomonas vaginalis G3]